MWFFLARRLSLRCHSVALTVRHILILEWRLGTTLWLVRRVNKHNLYHPSPGYTFCCFLQFSPVSPYFAEQALLLLLFFGVFQVSKGKRGSGVERETRATRPPPPLRAFLGSPEKREKEAPVPKATLLDRIKWNSKPPVFLLRCREKNLQDWWSKIHQIIRFHQANTLCSSLPRPFYNLTW